MESKTSEPSIQLLAEAAQNETRGLRNGNLAVSDQDDRSSSLSDIDDQQVTDNNDRSSQNSDAEDTEAETERLEESPLRRRKQKEVVLSGDLASGGSAIVEEKAFDTDLVNPGDSSSRPDRNRREQCMDGALQTSEISSLGESADASELDTRSSSSSKKRKRENNDDTKQSLKKVALELANHVADQAEEDTRSDLPLREPIGGEEHTIEDVEASDDEADHSTPEEPLEDARANDQSAETQEVPESNDDDVDMEYTGQEADVTSSIRSEEEMARKKVAIDMLSKIEASFAILRDKLFAEKNTQLTEELATMQAENITHPEYLAMVEAIEQLRNDRLKRARYLYNYKIQALQNRSEATRAQILSQYVQAARELRENALEKIGKEWYQIQRGRRRIEEDENVALNHFTGNKMDHIAQHTAYNTEVSILSGVAKYIGFPAAPTIEGSSQAEIEEDLRQMGISQQLLNVPVASALNFSRQRPAAEDQFIENTPWANPAHPAHAMNNSTRHTSNLMRPSSPFTTPVAQKQAIDAAIGSASTIAAFPSSSIGPTPQGQDPISNMDFLLGSTADHSNESPSKAQGHASEEMPPNIETTQAAKDGAWPRLAGSPKFDDSRPEAGFASQSHTQASVEVSIS